MLRFLLRVIIVFWIAFMTLVLAMLGIGKTAPEISTIAFFEQETLGTPYWRLDLFTGVSLADPYEASVWITELDRIFNNPIKHFITIERRAEYYRVYENHFDIRELTLVGEYPAPEYGDVFLAGDYLFLFHYEGNRWMRIDLRDQSVEELYLGRFGEFHQISPDGQWMARRVNNQYHFVNILDGLGYQAPNYYEVRWSPDSQWYIAAYFMDTVPYISVLNTTDGSSHPNLPTTIAAENAVWSADGASIIYNTDSQLVSMTLETAEIHTFGFTAENFWLTCLSPNQRHIISYEDSGTYLHDTETGEKIWELIQPFSFAIRCNWSEDSRYLVVYNYLNIPATGGTNILEERFFVIDTAWHTAWDLYPTTLPHLPIYLHIPD